jgi:hypothetical protein
MWRWSGSRGGIAVTIALATTVALSGCGQSSSSEASPAGPTPSESASFEPTDADFADLRALLKARASAVLQHHEAAFLATVDDRDKGLLARQRTIYDNLAQLPLASLSYPMDTSALLVPAEVAGDDPTLRPGLVEQLRIRGTMPAPISNAVDDTFVRRGGHWLLGAEAETDAASGGDTSGERPWGGGPIAVQTDGPLTVLVDASRSDSLPTLTREISTDIDADASLLGVPAQHAILVDATSNGASTPFSSLSKEQAGAVTFGLSHTNATGDTYQRSAGLAIKINPHDVATLAGSTPLLRHELTHFLLHEYLGSSPRWLSEGVANWVEYYPDDYPALRLFGNLYARVMHSDRELPAVGSFNYDPDVHYQVAQAAVAWLIDHYGMPRLLDLMRAYRARYTSVNVDPLTPRLLHQEYGITEQQLVDGAFGLISTFQH